MTQFTFLHAADIHLDSPLRGLDRYDAAPVEAMRGATRRAFANLVQYAINEKVAFILLAGDLYDGDWKDYSTGIFFSQQLGKLKAHHIRVYAVAGNHDAANKMTKALDSPSNMTLLTSRRAEAIHLPEWGVMIHGRSFGTQQVYDNLVMGFAPADPNCFNIGLLHTSLDGREGHAPYAPCTLDDLRAKGYHYWALGHVHQQEIVAQDPWIVFPGCLQGRHIRETGTKGAVLVTVQYGAVYRVTPVALDVVRWVLCRVEVSTATTLQEIQEQCHQAMSDALTTAEGRILAMRIRLEGASPCADQLAAYPERLEQQLRALGAELAGDMLWIERVENAVTPRRNLATVMADDTALAKLLIDINNILPHPAEIDGLDEILREVRQKLPPEAFTGTATFNLADATTQERLIQEAKQMLIGRLLSGDTAP